MTPTPCPCCGQTPRRQWPFSLCRAARRRAFDRFREQTAGLSVTEYQRAYSRTFRDTAAVVALAIGA